METVSGNLASALRIEPGITAIIGSGGKSTLLKTLGLELMRAGGRVLLCTTTHMLPVAGVPWDGRIVAWTPRLGSRCLTRPRLHLRGLRGPCARKHLPGRRLGPGDRQALRPRRAARPAGAAL